MSVGSRDAIVGEPRELDGRAELRQGPSSDCDAAYWLEYSTRALELAGQSLGPERASRANAQIGRMLLRESFEAVGRLLPGAGSGGSVSDAVAPRIRGGSPAAALCVSEDDRRVLALALDGGVDAALPDAERVVGRLIDEVRRRSTPSRAGWPRRRILAAAFVAILVTAAGPALFERSPWKSYRWTASSGDFGHATSGLLGKRGRHDLLFHTANEANPWLLIDMLEPRTIARIILENRLDCCAERGLPMVVEAGETAESMAELGRRSDPFDTWILAFAPRRARFVRIRSEATTVLHLREVRIP
jgi:hypothetical protein